MELGWNWDPPQRLASLLLRSLVPKLFSSTGLPRPRTNNWTPTAMTALESGARRSRRTQRGAENVPGAFAAIPKGVNNVAPTSSGYELYHVISFFGSIEPLLKNPPNNRKGHLPLF